MRLARMVNRLSNIEEYVGIFTATFGRNLLFLLVINDEQPGLTNWVVENFSNGTAASRPPFNRFFYSKVFELLLRLKANYMWPGLCAPFQWIPLIILSVAMWNSAFGVDDPLNQFTADYYGIVMGTRYFLLFPG